MNPDTGLVSIVGAGHSGSTLLDLMLGSHESMLSLGEMSFYDDWIANDKACTCGQAVSRCAFWRAVAAEFRAAVASGGRDGRDVSTELRSRAGGGLAHRVQNRLCAGCVAFLPGLGTPRALRLLAPGVLRRAEDVGRVYAAARKVAGRPILVDSSKSAYRMALLHALAPETTRVLHLTRDGRGWVASYLRRMAVKEKRRVPVAEAARTWRRSCAVTQRILRGLPRERWLHVRYEELCRDPEGAMRRVCRHVGAPYSGGMLAFRGGERHNIGGNPMRMRREDAIQEDLRWRADLTPADLRTFEAVAGDLNRTLLGELYEP